MPKQSALPGKLGDICRAIGVQAACARLGITSGRGLQRLGNRKREWSEEFHAAVKALHREVVTSPQQPDPQDAV